MADSSLAIRALRDGEVALAIDWAAAEGWNPGVRDAETFAAADAGAFIGGFLGAEPVAVVSAVRYGATFGFLGFYIVAPAHRGRGFGLQVWQVAIRRLAGRTIGLDGVLEQEATYRRSGFEPAFHSVRFAGVAPRQLATGPGVVDLAGVPLDALLAYDRRFFPADRTRFLTAWVRQPDAVARAVLDDDGAPAGYAVRRACRSGHKIGPLFANTPALADALLRSVTADLGPADEVFLDVPLTNPDGVALAERHGMTPAFETVRMYAGPEPELAIDRTYGITSFELG